MSKILNMLLAAGLLAGLSGPALALGAGSYAVKGTGESGSPYSGTLVIARTSDSTYKLSWTIDGKVTDGSGIGSDEGIAVTFKSGSTLGTSLLFSDGAGGYKSVWTYYGDKKLGYEELTPK